ncbi:hypothetical protein FIBSPDRAFT_844491 [Athelia psychrophila]|uniref:C3H1-type domain-containing protein n=1 Tax=Athelia psychrophila TaxID=1759441 RepID=A0A167UG99_9AGAM|nr:hypothetical protein FIBSPDRAFT_844491 [Fibularhizoctonia sp. CBS 109695]
MSAVCFEFAKGVRCSYGDGCRFAHVRSPSAARIQQFFGEYPSFNYSRSSPIMSEFWRMCQHFNWDKEDEDREEAHKAFKDALTQQFNDYYGTDVDNIASWQKLCRRLGVEPIPEGLQACRAIIEKTHVNLVDLVDNGRFEIFKSLEDLRVYTIDERKFFPLDDAYAGGLLKFLLREILHKYNGGQNKQSRGHPHRGGRRGARRG